MGTLLDYAVNNMAWKSTCLIYRLILSLKQMVICVGGGCYFGAAPPTVLDLRGQCLEEEDGRGKIRVWQRKTVGCQDSEIMCPYVTTDISHAVSTRTPGLALYSFKTSFTICQLLQSVYLWNPEVQFRIQNPHSKPNQPKWANFDSIIVCQLFQTVYFMAYETRRFNAAFIIPVPSQLSKFPLIIICKLLQSVYFMVYGTRRFNAAFIISILTISQITPTK